VYDTGRSDRAAAVQEELQVFAAADEAGFEFAVLIGGAL
jgi:hypothetical protein